MKVYQQNDQSHTIEDYGHTQFRKSEDSKSNHSNTEDANGSNVGVNSAWAMEGTYIRNPNPKYENGF